LDTGEVGRPRDSNSSQEAPSPVPPSNPQAALLQIAAQLNIYQGALPNPAILEAYERIVPGSAERLIRLAEGQTHHRQGLEQKAIVHELRRSNLGLVVGGIVVLGLEAVAGLAVTHGQGAGGIFLGAGSLATLGGAFIYGTRSRRAERETKARIMTEQMQLPMGDGPRQQGS
jgi:uncharacterized membrane protein